jgi:LysR family glycine cleavage system transcriptional activator
VAAVDGPRPSKLGYWLAAPLPQWRQKKVKTLVE